MKLSSFVFSLAALRKARAVVLDDPNEETALVADANQVISEKKGMILPFKPLTMTFHNVNYYVDMPKVNFTSLFCFGSISLYLWLH